MHEYRQATLLRIALTNSIGFSASTAVPLWIGSAGAHFGFPAWGAGAVATGQLACTAMFNLATPWLFRGAHPGKLVRAAAAVAVLSNLLACFGPSPAFVAGCLSCGASFGVLLNVANRLVAGSSTPQRGYALLQLVEVLFCIGFYLSVPLVAVRFGILSVFAVLAALSAGALLLLSGVPVDASGHPRNAARDRAANPGAALLSLCAAALLFAGYSAVSNSLVPIGAAVGLSVLWVGRVMAAGLFVGLGGAVIARTLGSRAGALWPLLAGAALLAGDILLMTSNAPAAVFTGSAIALFVLMPFVVPYVFTFLAGLDRAGRWASIGPAFVLTGVALGPGLAGVMIRGTHFGGLGIAASACIGGAMALFLCADSRRSRRPSTIDCPA